MPKWHNEKTIWEMLRKPDLAKVSFYFIFLFKVLLICFISFAKSNFSKIAVTTIEDYREHDCCFRAEPF